MGGLVFAKCCPEIRNIIYGLLLRSNAEANPGVLAYCDGRFLEYEAISEPIPHFGRFAVIKREDSHDDLATGRTHWDCVGLVPARTIHTSLMCSSFGPASLEARSFFLETNRFEFVTPNDLSDFLER